MHEAVTELHARLEAVIAALQGHIPSDEPFGNAHNNWSFPGVSRTELIEEVQSIIDLIQDHDADVVGDSVTRIADYVRRLDHLCAQTIPHMWGNASQAVPAFQLTMDGLRKALSPLSGEDEVAESRNRIRQLKRKLRSMEADVNGLEPRAATLVDMVGRVEQAHEAADRLPTDLESLAEARKLVSGLVEGITVDRDRVSEIRARGEEVESLLNESADGAKAVLERCETAYSAATSVGLAAAFSERSRRLSVSIGLWVGGLIAALAAGSFLGTSRLLALASVFSSPEASVLAVTLNVLLSVLAVGASVWFAWLSTKQIGQRFRLAEDYGYKAAIARTYEGFRREAARIDKDMEAELLRSALSHLDEIPLRLVEEQSHGSPWHELASSDVVKRAMNEVPDFAGEVRRMARQAIDAIASTKGRRERTPPATEGPDEPPRGDQNA